MEREELTRAAGRAKYSTRAGVTNDCVGTERAWAMVVTSLLARGQIVLLGEKGDLKLD